MRCCLNMAAREYPVRFNCANRSIVGTTVPGHFAQTCPVLGRLVREGFVSEHFAPAELFFGDFARVSSLPAHYGRAGRLGAFAWIGDLLGHFSRPGAGHLEWTVRARPVPAHLSPPPKLAISQTELQMAAHSFPSESDRRVQRLQQFRRRSARSLRSAARP